MEAERASQETTEEWEDEAGHNGAGPSRRLRRSPLRRFSMALAEEVGRLHLRMRMVNLVLFFCPQFCFNRLRTMLYRWCGFRIGRRSLILGNIDVTGEGRFWERLQIGRGSWLNSPLFADLNASITIGNRVAIGHHVVLITTTHDSSEPRRRCGKGQFLPIVIEDGCWIGARVTILPGVTIGKGAVVGAGSVVAADVAPHMVVWGVPARPVNKLPGEEA
jgi:maltose O-acetyltransferase